MLEQCSNDDLESEKADKLAGCFVFTVGIGGDQELKLLLTSASSLSLAYNRFPGHFTCLL